jgi:hypothetical protein
VITLAVGSVYIIVRGKYSSLYGLLEVLVAVVTIGLAVTHAAEALLPKLAAISAGVYIFVRGTHNIYKGL